MRNKLDILVLIYAILLIVLGIIGFVGVGPNAKHSLVSIIAGGGMGAIVIGLLAYGKTNPRVGRIGTAVVSLLAFGQVIPKFIHGTQMWHHYMIGSSSLIVFVALLAGHLMAKSKSAAAGPLEGSK